MVGMGVMGEANTIALIRACQQYPELDTSVRLVAAADPVEGRRTAAAKLGYERFTTDWRDVIESPDVDIVGITTPNVAHREVAIAAAENGKPFWIEKPVGRNSSELLDIVAAVERADVPVLVGFNYRQTPVVQHARAMLRGREIGELRHFRATFLAAYASHPDGALSWRFSRQLAGHGVLGDLMSHVVDLSQHLLGPIVEVCGTHQTLVNDRPVATTGLGTHFSVIEGGERQPVENEDWAGAIVRFESGLIGILEASRVIVGPHNRLGFEVNGAEGAIAWNLERLNELNVCRVKPHPAGYGYETILAGMPDPDYAHFMPGTGLPMGYTDLKVIEAARLIETCRDGVVRGARIEDALQTARVIDAILESAASRTWVTIPTGNLAHGYGN